MPTCTICQIIRDLVRPADQAGTYSTLSLLTDDSWRRGTSTQPHSIRVHQGYRPSTCGCCLWAVHVGSIRVIDKSLNHYYITCLLFCMADGPNLQSALVTSQKRFHSCTRIIDINAVKEAIPVLCMARHHVCLVLIDSAIVRVCLHNKNSTA